MHVIGHGGWTTWTPITWTRSVVANLRVSSINLFWKCHSCFIRVPFSCMLVCGISEIQSMPASVNFLLSNCLCHILDINVRIQHVNGGFHLARIPRCYCKAPRRSGLDINDNMMMARNFIIRHCDCDRIAIRVIPLQHQSAYNKSIHVSLQGSKKIAAGQSRQQWWWPGTWLSDIAVAIA